MDAMDAESARKELREKAMIPHSLGALETLCVSLAGENVRSLEKPCLLIFASDHGITNEGVTHSDKAVTFQMARAFAHGEGVAGLFARLQGVPLTVIDVGMDTDEKDPLIVERKILRGDRDFLTGDSLSENEVEQALEVGRACVRDAVGEGHDCILLGEMGVGNSTIASALVGRMGAFPLERIVGIGSGGTKEDRNRKIEVIQQGYRLHPDTPVFQAFGGLEIAAMAGAMEEASALHVPVLLDGFITYASALYEKSKFGILSPLVIASHVSGSPGSSLVLDALHLSPLLSLGMRLGEGTGALAAWPLVRLASHLWDLKSFRQLSVPDSGVER